jgi:GTP cyclohydrolase II
MVVHKAAEADFPTRFGHFRIMGFTGPDRPDGSKQEYAIVAMGLLSGEPVLVRMHSQCLTGDVFHSLRCDCGLQLEASLELIAREGRGILIYDSQEGRGIGLVNKLRAYELQDHGADTVEANLQLGFDADQRSYAMSAAILRSLGVQRVKLISNNPSKIQGLVDEGIDVTERVPCVVDSDAASERYLEVKRAKMGHLL